MEIHTNGDPSAPPTPSPISVLSAFPFIDRRHFLSADVSKCVLGPQPDIVRNRTVIIMLLCSFSLWLFSDELQEVIMSHLLVAATSYPVTTETHRNIYLGCAVRNVDLEFQCLIIFNSNDIVRKRNYYSMIFI